MNITLILFLIGILGFVLNRKNIILMLISIEIMLLAITFLILVSSLNIDDIIGQTYAIYIIAVAGAESAIGLGILVAFYRLNSSLNITCISLSLETYSKKIFNSYAHYSSRPAVFLLDPCQGQAKKTSYLKSKESLIISRALIKYGYSNFSLTILEYCEKSELQEREQFYLDSLGPVYNILKIAGSSSGHTLSEGTKAKISQALKGVYVGDKSP